MTEQHPITPPPELVDEWFNDNTRFNNAFSRYSIATQAARWGGDQELEACCAWLSDRTGFMDAYDLRAARRPKPPSLKDQALKALWCIDRGIANPGDTDTIRRALEQLDD